MINWKSMSIKDFKTFFSDFTIAVSDKKYHKMDYSTWKKIKDCAYDPEGKDRMVNFSYHDSCGIGIEFPFRSEFYRFAETDESFGQYVYEKLYEYRKEIPCSIADPEGIVSLTEPAIYVDTKVNTATLNIPSSSTYTFTMNAVKEKKSMKFNFDFGPVKNDNIRMSVYGMAVRNTDGTFVSYDKTNGSVIDVDVFNFDGSKFMYKMPVALKDVTAGDVVIHNHVPMFVTDVNGVNGTSLEVVDIYHGENKSIIPTTNMFGFNFVTKVVSLIDMGTPNKDNPFGNMLPFLMMGDEDANTKDLAMAMMFMNGNTNMMQNPLMMMMLLDKDSNSDMLPMIMMMNNMNFNPQPAECDD